MGQRLFAIDVLAVFHGRHGGHGVGVVRRADQHRVDLAGLLVEHRAEVPIAFGLREPVEHIRRPAVVNVAQGDDVLAGHVAQVAGRLAAGADRGDVQLAAGRDLCRGLPARAGE